MDGFTFTHRETARFRDLDPMGHVNNAVYLTWIENARIEFLRRLGAFDRPYAGDMAMILARAEVDFRDALGFGEEVEIGVKTSRLGTKSFDLEYELRSGERVVAEAKTVLVAYDYATNRSKEIPEEWRQRLAA
ncbi:MAG TPA: thioesterase family protein [Gaiellaceae bacterium]|jgi:acyl-CoA thioester hydrolase|nr:thioesterase family protein [Gaiellaceae bacterium]